MSRNGLNGDKTLASLAKSIERAVKYGKKYPIQPHVQENQRALCISPKKLKPDHRVMSKTGPSADVGTEIPDWLSPKKLV